MADPTCPTCPPDKRVESYPATTPDGVVVTVTRCQECGNQCIDGAPATSPAAPQVFEETVNGGERVIRRPKAKQA